MIIEEIADAVACRITGEKNAGKECGRKCQDVGKSNDDEDIVDEQCGILRSVTRSVEESIERMENKKAKPRQPRNKQSGVSLWHDAVTQVASVLADYAPACK